MSDEEAVVEVNAVSVPASIDLPSESFIGHRLSDDQINAISGAFAGVAAGIVVCPLDVAKTRLQAQGGLSSSHAAYKYRGMFGTLRTIVYEEGFRGLYRGLTPIIVGYIPTWTIYFLIYEKTKAAISRSTLYGHQSNSKHIKIEKLEADQREAEQIAPPASNLSALQHISAAVTAGAVSTLVTNPIWVVKTRLMSQRHYKNTLDAVKTMYLTEGVKVFYRGLGPAYLGLLHVAIQFPLYERFKALFPSPATPVQILTASFFSKIIASSLTYPHEVIRTRNQIHLHSKKYHGIIHTVKTILREEGWRAFYAGLGTNLVRAVPSSAITLLTYELVSTRLKTHRATI